ncbi:hypothetical protein [Erwinia sp. E_sp_W01_6]|uniref:hypothetical protein n=1 Tax=Erwinia sp. E_sp_W01_6 TaxID=3039408 RepID=UPI0030CDD962
MAIIACLHAARSNIAVFEEALNALEFEDVELLHRVESQWLDQAVEASEVTPEIAEHVRQAIEELCQHADAVIVTCTTLGVVAWDARQFSKPVLRIDATLAKAASRYHGSVLVLCTAQSTLESTTHLFAAFVTGDRLAVELIPEPGHTLMTATLKPTTVRLPTIFSSVLSVRWAVSCWLRLRWPGQKNISTVRWPF